MQTCAVQLHVNISQEPLHAEMNRKNAVPKLDPRSRTHTLREPAQSKCTSTFNFTRDIRRATVHRNNQEIAASQIEPRRRTLTLCEPAQSKCMLTFHKSHLVRKFTGNVPQPRLSPECTHTHIHTHRHFVRACAVETHVKKPFYTEIYWKRRGTRVSTLITGLYTFCKNPSVWRHFLVICCSFGT